MTKKLLILGTALAVLLAMACSLPQGSKFSGTSLLATGAEDQTSPALENDGARNQAVYITASGLKLDIMSVEEAEGTVVRCVEGLDIALVGSGTLAAAADSQAGLAALVIGRREDGRPGLWAVHGDNSIRALPNSRGVASCLLPEPEDVEFMMTGLFGWIYHATELSPEGENGWIVIGYAENPDGFSRGRWSVEPGTTVGVYWRIRKHPHRHFYKLLPARVIGIFKKPPCGNKAQASEDPHRNTNRHRSGFGLGLLKLFLLEWLENYLTMTTGVDYRDGLFLVTGPDKDGIASLATIDNEDRITIEPLAPQPAEVDLVPGLLQADGGPIPDGSQLPLELAIGNLGTAALDRSFHLRFFIAPVDGFPAQAVDLEEQEVSLGQPLPAGGSLAYQTVITLPDELDLSGWYYLGVRLDSQGEVAESDESNNESSKETAALIALTDDEAGPVYYNLVIQTFPPTGSEKNTYAKIELFRSDGGLMRTGTVYASPWVGIGSLADPLVLSSGTYFIKVSGANEYQTGPYGISARLVSVGLSYYTAALADNSQDAAEPDDALTAPNIPDNPLPLFPADAEGSQANRYIGGGEADWARIILP